MAVRLSFLLVVLASVFSSAKAWRSFKVVFDNVTVTSNPKWASLEIDIKTVKEDSVLDVHINLHKTIPSAMIRGYLRFNSINDDDSDQLTFVEVINKTANLCQLLAGKIVAPVIRLSFAELSKYGVMFTQCPLQKTHYYMQNFKMDEELLPPYLPETDFLAEIHVFTNQSGSLTNYWDIVLNGRIDKSKGFDNLKQFTMG